MKPNEFIKRFGFEKTSSELSLFQSILVWYFGRAFVDELKRLVKSHEIVNKTFKGLDDAKWWYECCQDCDSVAYIEIDRLKQAIEDMESCQ